MKDRKISKFLIPLLLAMALMININGAKAQVPCDSAILLTQTTTCNYYNQTVTTGNTEYWYTFVADTSDIAISTIQYGTPVGQQSNLEIYSYDGSCNNLTLIQQNAQELYVTNLTVNGIYYIRVYQFNSFNFGLCIKKVTDIIIGANPTNNLIGDGYLSNFYNNTACGLNYTQASKKITTRYPTPAGGLPCDLTLAGLPTGCVIEAAYLYWTVSYKGSSTANQVATMTANGVTNQYPAVLIGSDVDKCWGEGGTRAFRANVTPAIFGNGLYSITAISGNNFSTLWEVDGVTLFVIYRDLFSSHKGTLVLDDGLITTRYLPFSHTMQNFTACGNSVDNDFTCGAADPSAFLIFSDVQDNVLESFDPVLNGTPRSGLNRGFWDFVSAYAPVVAGQTTASYSSPNIDDCFSVCLAGLYFQTNTCGICIPSTPHSEDLCINEGESATLFATGGGTYLWNTGETTSTIIVSPSTTTTYSVTVSNGNCAVVDVITVFVLATPIISGPVDACDPTGVYTITNYNAGYVYYYYWASNPNNLVLITTPPNTFTVTYPNGIVYPGGFGGDILHVRAVNEFCDDISDASIKVFKCCNKNNDFSTVIHDITITTSTTIATEKYVNGLIIIDANVIINSPSIYFGPNAKIIINSGRTLTITNSQLTAYCDTMWDGIYLTDNTSHLIINDGSLIRDAKNAIVSNNGGVYTLSSATTNVLMRNNYRNIVVNLYTATHNSSVANTTFDCNATLLPQYPPITGATKTYSGIEIYDNFKIFVGDSVGGILKRNTFQGIDYGVYASRSNIIVYNNNFYDITNVNSLVLPSKGTAVYVGSGKNAYTAAVIGKAGFCNNTFNNCNYGVALTNAMVFARVDYNTFTLSSSPYLTQRGVVAKPASISNAAIRNNTFVNGVNSIQYIDMKADSRVIISNNTISNTKLGIEVSNAIATNTGTLAVSSNQITDAATGILLTNCNGNKFYNVRVQANSILFTNPNFNSTVYYGIRVQNGLYTTVNTGNTVTRTTTTAPNATNAVNLNGIALEYSARGNVSSNTLTRMGCGIRYAGSMPLTKTTCNIMNTNFYGVRLDGADIGIQGTVGTPNIPWDNQWINQIAAPGYRIQGTLATGATCNWYYYNSGNYIAIPTSVGGPLFAAIPAPFANYCGGMFMSGGSTITNPLDRQTAIGTVVDAIDPTTVALMGDESQYQGVKAVYDILKEEPALLDMNAIDDTKYQEFFDAAQESNIGKLNGIDSLIENDSANVANIANSNVENQNMIEFNKTTVNEIYLRTWAIGELVLSNADSTTLLNIAMQNPLIAGEGVYGARVMIGLQFDNYASNERVNNNQTTIVPDLEKTVKVFPNPAKEELSIEFSTLNTDKVLTFELYNAMGVLVYKQLFNGNDYLFKVSLNKITGGCYTYKIKDQTTIIAKDKLVIIK